MRSAPPTLLPDDPVAVRIAGVDEVGRGCLAGPVYAAAVVLAPGARIADLNDSKKLSAPKRRAVAQRVREQALAWAIGRAEVAEIDALNILQATFLAMRRERARRQGQPAAQRRSIVPVRRRGACAIRERLRRRS